MLTVCFSSRTRSHNEPPSLFRLAGSKVKRNTGLVNGRVRLRSAARPAVVDGKSAIAVVQLPADLVECECRLTGNLSAPSGAVTLKC